MLLVTKVPFPQKSNGFIDEDQLFTLIVGTLKLCTITEYENFIEEVQPFAVGLLFDAYVKEQKEHYEMIAQAVKVGTVNAQNGKNHPMFKKEQDKKKVQKSTIEEKQQTLADLHNIFGK